MTPDERIAELEDLLARQSQQLELALARNVVLEERVRDLEARLAKDSHNSGKPPASDGLARKTKSLCKRSSRKPGEQLGHRGETLRLVAVPDEVVEHRPRVCATCHKPLGDEAAVVLDERRQVHEVPPLRLHIREHQVAHLRCPHCAQVTAGTFPSEAPVACSTDHVWGRWSSIWSSSNWCPTGACATCSSTSLARTSRPAPWCTWYSSYSAVL